MDKFFFSEVYFDLENIVYSAWHKMKQRVDEGRMIWDFLFRPEQITQHVVLTIEERLSIDYGILIPIYVVSESNKHLLKYCMNGFCGNGFSHSEIAPEGRRITKGSQVADLRILDCLCDKQNPATGDIGVVVVSGDGCYIDELVRLFKLGYIVGAVSTKWSLHGDYFKELGRRSVVALDESWLDEVIRRTQRSLPLASLNNRSYRRRIYCDRNAGV